MAGKRRDARKRFEAKFSKAEDEDCWLWNAAKDSNGYGRFGLNGKTGAAHRASWELYRGPIPDGLWVLHRCDTPACVNPNHLFLGTPLDNTRDMDAKGRRVTVTNPDNKPPLHTGDNHPLAKLNLTLVAYYRERHANGESIPSLAREAGINKA